MKRINNKDEGYKLIALAAFLFLLFSTCYAEAAEYNATYTPGPIDPIATGQTKNVSVTVKNTGTQTWTPGVTSLSYHWYQGSTCIVWDGERTSLPKSVAPNETITLNAKVLANVPDGSYTLKWDMLGPATWFSQKSPPVPTGNQSIEVKNWFVEVVASVNLSALVKAMLTPNIYLVFPTPPLEPEGEYYIAGSQFGDKPGQVKMTLPSGKTINLVVQQWWLGQIRVHVPAITGEKDGSASIQVETSNNFASNKVSVNFEATRDIVKLPKDLVQADCADPAGSMDECMWAVETFSASHQSWCCFQGDNDTDKFWTKASLKNGWVIKDYSYMYGDSCNTIFCSKPGGNLNVKTFSGKGTPSMQVTIDWSDKLDGGIFYCFDVYIVGPKGVPYQ